MDYGTPMPQLTPDQLLSTTRAVRKRLDFDRPVPRELLEECIALALQARSRFDIQSDGMRLVHGESDGLPGLIVDRYGDTLVAQFTSAGVERWKPVIARAQIKPDGV